MIKNIIIFSLLFSSQVFGENNNEKINYIKLSQDSTWLKLLYYDKNEKQSEVLSDDYFLSSDAQVNPLSELKSTIKAYYKPFTNDSDAHAICKFPARYKWLSSKIHLKNYQTIHPKCTRLIKSYKETKTDSISLMFVTGYLGNPASSFGHSFFKLNNKQSSNSNLFDISISYGADVPKNENIFLYMYRGLFGKYSATFNDKYFYTHDLIYSSNELRDIWEYELNLSREQIEFFKLHIWEIIGKKFKYLFLNKNCAYEVSKMLEVILDYKLVKSANVWFAPIETFHELADNNDSPSIIKKITFHPSEQKKIYKKFNELTKIEKENVINLLNNQMNDKDENFNNLNIKEKINVIDYAINYYNYLSTRDKKDESIIILKKEALLRRFSLPVKRENILNFNNLITPDQNDKPRVFYINFNSIKNQKNFTSIGFMPYAIQGIGQNNLNGDELIVLNTEIGFNTKKAFLNKFNFISIKRFEKYNLPLEINRQFSWKLDISIDNIDILNNKYDAYIEGGIGKTWIPINWLMMYGMINTSLHSYNSQFLITPEIGLRFDFKAIKSLATFQKEILVIEKNSEYSIDVISNINIYEDTSLYIKINYTDNNGYNLSSGIQFYF